jgi:hypothetical protein
MRGLTLNVETQLITEECYSCHILFAFPESLKTELLRQKAGRQFFCPNGHSQHYIGEREEDVLKRQLARAEQDRDYYKQARTRLAEDNMTLAKTNASLRGNVTKLKKRAANGVCAFCHRSFQNVQRHVLSKHPEAEHVD